ncbi:MAG: hypothetical protein CVT98_05975 [Bacteroidetes bacterium HGW-Bacteroidetes-15]|nr:MAG: hypothetical protein CVT98_05975 [Bacteroidetes bacterium HGW-Bacteroidetes-15]
MEISIREYCSADYDEVMSLWKDIGLGGAQRGDNQQIIEHSIELGGQLLLAVTTSGEIVGTSWMTFDGRRIHLHHFGVKSNYQRMCIGDKLTIESLRFAKRKGYQIKLEVHNTNHSAINLYKKHGFAYLGDYDVYIIRDLDGLKL